MHFFLRGQNSNKRKQSLQTAHKRQYLKGKGKERESNIVLLKLLSAISKSCVNRWRQIEFWERFGQVLAVHEANIDRSRHNK